MFLHPQGNSLIIYSVARFYNDAQTGEDK